MSKLKLLPPSTPSPSRACGVEVVTRSGLAREPHWQHAFAHQRKDHRYYELIDRTLCPDFDYRYFVIRDENGAVCAIQPFFLLDQDLLAGVLCCRVSQTGSYAVGGKGFCGCAR